MRSMIKVALTIVERIPSIKLWAASFLKMCHSGLKELSKIKTGKNIASIPQGLAELIRLIDYPKIPKHD